MAKKKSFKQTANLFRGESNPFNIKTNRSKHSVLGRRVQGTKGLPVTSRAASHAKRKADWHKSRATAQKANRFLDRRLMDESVPMEEQMTSRLVTERKKRIKKSIFNLNEEDLTHKGVLLKDVTSFDDKGGSESDDEQQLDANFVKCAHFGGFNSSESQAPMTQKELLEQLIAESKIKKHEKKMEKEETDELTEKLDQDWKNLHSMMSGIRTGKTADTMDKKDPYDILAYELKFEMRGNAVVQTKSPEEIAKAEEEENKRLEEERQSRMVDQVEISRRKLTDHLSADSIMDDFDIQPISFEDHGTIENTLPDSEQEEAADNYDAESVDSFSAMQENKKTENADEIQKPAKNFVAEHSNFTNIPESMEDFQSCLDESEDVYGIVDEILKKVIRSKSEKVHAKLENLFSVLMQFSLDVDMTVNLLPHLHTIAEVSHVKTAEKFLSFLDFEQQLFEECKGKKMKNFPRLQTLLLLKSSSILYSVSDFRHPVVTPSVTLMCDILTSAFSMTSQNVIKRLFVANVILDCVSLSKRLVPELLMFLNKVLNLACKNKSKKKLKNDQFNLIFREEITSTEITPLTVSHFYGSALDDAKKLSIISECINQLNRCATLYGELLSYTNIFSEVLLSCTHLPLKLYPTTLIDSVNHLIQAIDQGNTLFEPLVYQNTKPKPLKLFEPLFDSKYDRRDNLNKKRDMVKSVSQKIKKEERGLLREMRRDAQMIAAEKLKETLEADAERKRKVKELYHELATQEGEYKKMIKKKD